MASASHRLSIERNDGNKPYISSDTSSDLSPDLLKVFLRFVQPHPFEVCPFQLLLLLLVPCLLLSLDVQRFLSLHVQTGGMLTSQGRRVGAPV